jgi:endonuclease/exonuclease/phosphatase (EEP) superfamily protein YafD
MENRDANRLLALVQAYSPDLLVTMESDQWWQDALVLLEEVMPYTVKCPLDNRYGMHLYSRLPLDDAHVEYIVEDDVPSIHAVVTLPSGAEVRLHVLHPAPPSPTENSESEERDAELIVVARRLADARGPILVAGDFNDIPWSRAAQLFRGISGLCDPRVGRGLFNTFHARIPLMRWPLDHLYHSAHFALVRIQRLGDIGSDHFPLYANLALVSTECSEAQADASESDLEEAREIVSAGKD